MVQLVEERKTGLGVGATTYHLHLRGRVQGVGFRPYVYKFARARGLKGNVRNDTDGVHVFFNARDLHAAEELTRDLIAHAPRLSIIKDFHLAKTDRIHFDDFEIAESQAASERRLMITPDLAMCDSCRKELARPDDRRYRYPFITCTDCGPRYSITHGLPYDRPLTTMAGFQMCRTCEAEYNDILNRRHYSQTNSCAACPVSMSVFDPDGNILVDSDNDAAAELAVSAIDRGDIVAVKGIGGYLLMADATQAEVVALLRKRKHRPRKPFALMYPDPGTLSSDVVLDEAAKQLLMSPESPIVLLPLKGEPESGIATDMICPGLAKVGAMLPYTGVFQLLMDALKRPLIATSGNISDAPIIYTDDKAVQDLSRLADLIVANDREICTPQDDSVVRQDRGGRPVILRRSRGMAPGIRFNPVPELIQAVMAAGADLKGAFGISANQEIYISQYLGNLEFVGSQSSYDKTYRHLSELLGFTPDIIACDLHPAYYSVGWAEQEALRSEVPLLKIQHHVAHFCSVLGENQLLEIDEPVLGIIWDGTGYGTDGQVWGGEFFTYTGTQIERVAHFKYYPHLFGDKMSREPRLSAYALLHAEDDWADELRGKFTAREYRVYQRFKSQEIMTSSAGRLFDAVASILGLCDVMDYEGEAAILLEEEGTSYLEKYGNADKAYTFSFTDEGVIDWSSAFIEIKRDIDAGNDAGEIALAFHNTLVNCITSVAQSHGIRHLAFSGGCFQNALLTSMCRSLVSKGYNVSFHKELSPNDENIAHGQLVYACLKLLNPELKFSK